MSGTPAENAPALSAAQFRELDRRACEEFGIPVEALMENAGRRAADAALEFMRSNAVRGPVLVLAGGGNNGGDGLAAARILKAEGLDAKVLLFKPAAALKGAARIHFEKAVPSVPVSECPDAEGLRRELSAASLVIDALLGTGFKGPVSESFRAAIDAVNKSGRPVIALDVPSGMDADSGDPGTACIRAVLTVSFHALKKGFLAAGAGAWTGKVQVTDIGFPAALSADVLKTGPGT